MDFLCLLQLAGLADLVAAVTDLVAFVVEVQ